jgi:hypothetical protein
MKKLLLQRCVLLAFLSSGCVLQAHVNWGVAPLRTTKPAELSFFDENLSEKLRYEQNRFDCTKSFVQSRYNISWFGCSDYYIKDIVANLGFTAFCAAATTYCLKPKVDPDFPHFMAILTVMGALGCAYNLYNTCYRLKVDKAEEKQKAQKAPQERKEMLERCGKMLTWEQLQILKQVHIVERDYLSDEFLEAIEQHKLNVQ